MIKNKTLLFLLLIIPLMTPSLFGQQATSIALKIGVAELQTDSSMQRTNGVFIATLLKNYLSRFQKFTIEDPELFKQLFILQQNRMIFAKKKELALLREKIDKNQFNRNLTVKIKNQKEYEAQLAILNNSLVQLQNSQAPTDNSNVSISIGNSLSSIVHDDPEVVCTRQSLDNVLYGSVKVLENMYMVTLKVYSSVAKKNLFNKTVVIDKDALEIALFEQVLNISETLFSRKFCIIDFTSDPTNASISINGNEIIERPFICEESGSYDIAVSAPGFVTHHESVSINPGERLALSFSLVPNETMNVTIESSPGEAMVYVNSIPMGITPLTLALDPLHDMITIDKAEYLQVMQPAETGPEITIDLTPSFGLTFDEIFEQAKGRFYKSLGWFVVSLPVTALSYGSFMSIYQTELEMQTRVLTGQLSLSESQYAAQQLDGYYWASQGAFWVSLALSTGLAVNAIIQFIRYINVM